MNFLVLNGPNLNLLGEREPEVYGTTTLRDIQAGLEVISAKRKHKLGFVQSNAEHELIEKIHAAKKKAWILFCLIPAPLLIPVLPYVMPCWERLFRLSKCICQYLFT